METEKYLTYKSYANGDLNFEDIAQVTIGHDEESLYLLVHSYRRKQTLTGTTKPWENTALIVSDTTDFFESLRHLCNQRLSTDIEAELTEKTDEVVGEINDEPFDFIRYNIEPRVVSFQCFEDDGTKLGHQLGVACIPIAEVYEEGEIQDEDNLETLVAMIDMILDSYGSQTSSRNSMNEDSDYDAFISHASEDKDELVRPLAERLQELGVDVWYDEFELSVGDKLRKSIDRGLANSNYGIVVLSPNFFDKGWPEMELDGLVAKDAREGKTILPIWHNVGADDISEYSPIIASRLAISSDSKSVDEIAQELCDKIKPGGNQ